MESHGQLHEETVHDLLARLSDARASGTLHLHGDPGSARIVLSRGYVRAARAHRAPREEDDRARAAFVGRRRKEFVSALMEVANWSGVTFEFEAGRPVDGEPFVPMIDPHHLGRDLPAAS